MNNDINELNMDYQTYKKISGTLPPKDKANVTITSDRPQKTTTPTSTTTSSSSMMTQMENEGSDAPVGKIKYLSNVKDAKTGEISKPFNIGDKRYQMVRGIAPNKEIILGVYCHDDINESGENIIHPVDYFEKNIAKPMKETMGLSGEDIQTSADVSENDYNSREIEYSDKDKFMDYLNLGDIGPEYKHFFVDITNGDVVAKFKTTKEMVKSGIKLGPNQDYMDAKALKRFRFGNYFKGDVSEEESSTNIPKLKADVAKLANLIKTKFSIYLTKLDKPIEQAQFLTAMANEIGVPLNKLSGIISAYKDIAQTNSAPKPMNPVGLGEGKIIKKKLFENRIKTKPNERL